MRGQFLKLHFKVMGKFKSILLVDDDDSNFISKIVINRSGITDSVTCVKNGNEALQYIINSSHPETPMSYAQIILLDLHMPVMDGFDFLEQLRRSLPNYLKLFKIFILTSSSNPSDIEKTKEYHVEGYINKPLDISKIKLIEGD